MNEIPNENTEQTIALVDKLKMVLLKIQTHSGFDENNCAMKPYDVLCQCQHWAEEALKEMPVKLVQEYHDLSRLESICEAASALEKWLGENAGTNDDWPIQMKADKEGADMLSKLLNDLQQALAPVHRLPD